MESAIWSVWGLASFTRHDVFKFSHGIAGICASFLLREERYPTAWLDHSFFIHSSADGHSGCFVCRDSCYYKCLCASFRLDKYFQFFWVYPWSGLAGSYGKSRFNFLRNCQTVFQSDWAVFHPRQRWMRGPVSPHPHQHVISHF